MKKANINSPVLLKSMQYGIVVVLFLPLILSISGIKERKLEGSFFEQPNPRLSLKDWFSGRYQNEKENYLSHHFPFHHACVRLQCQLDFSLFRKAHARFVVVGKEDYLFETSYLDSYLGRDFKGTAWIKEIVRKIKRLQDTLSGSGKLLLPVIAPGKGWFYPEYIPDRYGVKKHSTNYETLIREAAREQLAIIDFNGYFVNARRSSRYPLYPQFGIHWSNYAALCAFDSLCKFVESRLRCDLPDVTISEPVMSERPQAPDDDVLKGMNLISEPTSFPLAYSTYSVTRQDKNFRPRLLVIADSFWWYIYSTGLPSAVYSENSFWYYNEQMYPESETSPYFVKETNFHKRIREADVILILYSESNLYKFGNDFIEMADQAILKPGSQGEKIQEKRSAIRATPRWYEAVQKKAENKKISTDSMLTLDALYLLELEK